MLETFWRHRRKVLPICLAAIGVGLFVYSVRVWQQDGYSDFLVYYQTSQRLLSGLWSQVYRVDDNYNMFRYNPITLPFFWPWAILPIQWSREIFFLLNLSISVFGFWAIGRGLWGTKKFNERERFILIFVGALTLRFFLDGLWMGQVVGLMFGAVAGYFLALARGSAFGAGFAIWVPSSLKVGFAILSPIGILRGLGFWAKVGLAVVGISFGLGLIVTLCAGLSEVSVILRGWNATVETVLTPTSVLYWDCKDFRSQAINSALLRMSAWGWFGVKVAFYGWKAIAYTGLCALMGLWAWVGLRMKGRKPKPRMFGLLISLGVMAYLLFMPWTYRHTLAFLALPLIVLLSDEAKPRRWFWATFLAIMSLGGSSFMGERLAFWVQEGSLPVLVMLWMTAIIVQETRREVRRNGA